jgi:hypothetical protein
LSLRWKADSRSGSAVNDSGKIIDMKAYHGAIDFPE